MEKGFGNSQSDLHQYALDTFQPEDTVLRQVRANAKAKGLPPIHVGPMDGKHLEIITRLLNAKNAVEIGSLGGYSAICIARGLAPGGKLFTCEIEPAHARVAKENIQFADLSPVVQVLIGPALETLRDIESQGPFDLVFIDADKDNYPLYLEWAATHLRPGGAVIGDNTFAWGNVTKTTFGSLEEKKSAQGIRSFNQNLATSGRFAATLFPTSEGLSVGVKIR